jgi:hypothetical protein
MQNPPTIKSSSSWLPVNITSGLCCNSLDSCRPKRCSILFCCTTVRDKVFYLCGMLLLVRSPERDGDRVQLYLLHRGYRPDQHASLHGPFQPQ